MKEKKWFKRLSKFFKFLTIFAMLGLVLAYFSSYVHPNTIWFLPFFGLLYPVFLIINIYLLVLFVLFRSKWSFFILFVILIGGKLHFRQFAFGGAEKSESKIDDFTVMSYNVRLFDLYNWSVDSSNINRRKIFDFLNIYQPSQKNKIWSVESKILHMF